jgi:hypothetical protein
VKCALGVWNAVTTIEEAMLALIGSFHLSWMITVPVVDMGHQGRY